MKELLDLFSSTGERAVKAEIISGSGSNRQYYRIFGLNKSAIGVYGKDIIENKTFLWLTEYLQKYSIRVPQILAVSEDFSYYITEDLGDTSLFSLLNPEHQPIELLKKCVSVLPDIQFKAGKRMKYSFCYPQKEFDIRTVFWDLNYFKYEYLKPSGIEFDELQLEIDFENLAGLLLSHRTKTFMYRDFQSRNIMIKDGEPWFIDYQGGRRGPIYYDLASFIYQAKAQFADDIRKTLIDTYIESAKKYIDIERQEFCKTLGYFSLFRILQTLGAYGFRGLIEHKTHFIQSIPFAINNLSSLLNNYKFTETPYLVRLLRKMIDSYEEPFINNSKRLVVRVFSFSYKKGIPQDYSGNGGGYVFDCRAVHNPGKYEEYKSKTGLDAEVIKFIEENGEMAKFLDNVYSLADASVSRYKKRGFTDLMFSFGCTGGQHRSVYAAQHLAEHINNKYGVEVIVEHREQEIIETLEEKTV